MMQFFRSSSFHTNQAVWSTCTVLNARHLSTCIRWVIISLARPAQSTKTFLRKRVPLQARSTPVGIPTLLRKHPFAKHRQFKNELNNIHLSQYAPKAVLIRCLISNDLLTSSFALAACCWISFTFRIVASNVVKHRHEPKILARRSAVEKKALKSMDSKISPFTAMYVSMETLQQGDVS